MPKSPDAATTIDRLRALCLAQAGATERLSHGEPCWFAPPPSKKQFAALDNHHHGADHLSVWLAQPDGRQGDLVALDAARFFIPPYVGHRGWIAAVLDDDPPWDLIEQLVVDACRTVMVKRPSTSKPKGTTTKVSPSKR